MDVVQFFKDFQDHLAPKLDTYEQAIYLYVFRHSRLLGLEEVTIGFKSARSRMACGIGEKGTPMSEGSAYKKLQSLHAKGAISIIRTEHAGRLLRLNLPTEIPGVVPKATAESVLSIEELDFFEVPENRLLILQREKFRCFYTLAVLDEKNFVVEHVVSRPAGNNGYRNVVAASREVNNRKGAMPAEDYLRKLFRDGFLSAAEFDERLLQISRLKAGELRPELPSNNSLERTRDR
jgi:hypothetical protein